MRYSEVNNYPQEIYGQNNFELKWWLFVSILEFNSNCASPLCTFQDKFYVFIPFNIFFSSFFTNLFSTSKRNLVGRCYLPERIGYSSFIVLLSHPGDGLVGKNVHNALRNGRILYKLLLVIDLYRSIQCFKSSTVIFFHFGTPSYSKLLRSKSKWLFTNHFASYTWKNVNIYAVCLCVDLIDPSPWSSILKFLVNIEFEFLKGSAKRVESILVTGYRQ